MQLHIYTNPLALNESLMKVARDAGVMLNPLYFTLDQLINRLYSEETLPQRETKLLVIGKPLRQMLVHEAAAGNNEIPLTPGFTEEIANTLEEFEEAGLEPKDLEWILNRSASGLTSRVKKKLQTLHKVYVRLVDLHRRVKAVDRAGRDLRVLQFLLAHFRNKTRPQILGSVENVVIHDVYFLSIVQYGIVSLLMRLVPGGGIVFNFTDSANVEATRFIDHTWQRFVNDEGLSEVAIPEFMPSPEKPGALGKLRERVFSNWRRDDLLIPDNSFQIVATSDSSMEVEEVCRRVRRLLETGIPAQQIAILSKALPAYTESLLETAGRLRLPLEFDRFIPLFHLPIIKLIFKLLDLTKDDFEREAFLSVLTSVYLRPEAWVHEDIVGMVYESGYLDEQHGKLEDLLIRLSHISTKSSPKLIELADRVKHIKNILRALVWTGVSQKTVRTETFAEFAKRLRQLLADLGFFHKVAALKDVPLWIAYRDREALQTLFSVLDDAGLVLQLIGQGPISFRSFLEQIIELMSGVTLPARSRARHGVRVLSPVQTLGLQFDYVFLLGFSEGVFPRSIAESSLLKDQERRELNPIISAALARKFDGIFQHVTLNKALLTSFEKNRQEPLHIFLVLECAQEELTCSFPQRDWDGQVLLPSVYVEQISRHFATEFTESIRLPVQVPDTSDISDPRELLHWIAKTWSFSKAKYRLGNSQAASTLVRFGSSGLDLERLQRVALVEQGRKVYLMGSSGPEACWKGYYGDLFAENDLSELLRLSQRKWSPTEFEDMAACPFLHFAESFLGLVRRDPPTYDLKPVALGNLAHQVLKEFHSEALSGNPDQERQRMRLLINRVFQEWERKTPSLSVGYWQIRKMELQDALEDFAGYAALSLSDEFKSFSQEKSFGALLLLADLSLNLEGRPDWVELMEDEATVSSISVTDFKYSGDRARYAPSVKQDRFGITSFQLPLYLYLVWRHLREQGKVMAPDIRLLGKYILLRVPGEKKLPFVSALSIFEPSDRSGVILGIKKHIRRIQEGVFRPAPMPGICDSCDFGSLCRYWTSGAGDVLLAKRGGEE